MRSKRLLIVDDDDNILDLLRYHLSEFEDIQTASCGAAAIRMARERRPDLILLDVQMPDLDGFATCQALRSDTELTDVPIIFLTARQDSRTIVKCFKVGGNDFIAKPVNPAVLLQSVQSHLQV